ncbi:DUF4868 domain-containing protein [Labilibaculum sp. A4]|uniref:anti-phage protein KwaB n=1 Tax=Labilibaculum euxinus TaxID=2686357 RepID=UPI000F620B08|nr:anti-phage protein KwaB [Labilibaculum euxinus]MDQ1769358.1 anti-phage protein KwaB [Labilibaculum euxinus]MWN74884.1 DUF4868 domain-containing protein [Labilibaculum euxinus]
MTKEELLVGLEYFYNGAPIGITVYAILKDQEIPKKLDIEDVALPNLQEIFLQNINENIISKEELDVLKLSDSDERKNVIYEYDLEVPEELKALNQIIENEDIPAFNFKSDNFSDVKALLIEIGDNENQIVLYKKMATVNVFGRASYFLKKAKERFEQINDEFIRISSGFQLMKYNDTLFVIDLSTIEKFFGFHDVIIKEAEASMEVIEQLGILENPEALKELVSDISFARKLTKVATSSPVLRKHIPNADIIAFASSYPALKNKMRLNADRSKFNLDTRVSKDLFIKLLNDDFLTSQLTKLYYESLAKDGVEENETPVE